jgi:hypothetical protein
LRKELSKLGIRIAVLTPDIEPNNTKILYRINIKNPQLKEFMLGYESFPPAPLFKKVLLHYPKASLMFVDLYKASDKEGSLKLNIPKSSIKRDFKVSNTIFRNNLLSYARLELLLFDETPEFFIVDMRKRGLSNEC